MSPGYSQIGRHLEGQGTLSDFLGTLSYMPSECGGYRLNLNAVIGCSMFMKHNEQVH